MENKNYTVYMHVNKINSKKYIGITGRKPESRWQNGKGYCHNEYFNRAIKKYGWAAFDHKILFTNLSKEAAEQKENELILKYDTTNRSKGYNMTNGGESIGKHTEETKAKLKILNSGRPSYWKDKKLRPEMIQKIKESKQKVCIPIVKLDLNGNFIEEYNSICEAAKKNNIDKTVISRCCKGKQLTCDNHIYLKSNSFKDEIKHRLCEIDLSRKQTTRFKKGQNPWNAGKKNVYTHEQLEAMSEERSSRFKNIEYLKKYTKSVYQIDIQSGEIINEYISIAEAERQTGIRRISAVCNGKRNTAGGYKWKFCD